jgi:oligoribonuclease NrnB/cAMP/cGMP phosphodiesterase (DHH superfamily)
MRDFLTTQIALKNALKGLKSVAIGYHPDADGISATAILVKYLQKNDMQRKAMDFYPVDSVQRTFEREHLEDILAKKRDAIVCIDYSVTRYEQLYFLSKKFKNVIYIDHHRYQKELEKIPYLYINSTQFLQLTQPQLFTASKLMNSLLYDTSNDWLELTGLDGDIAIQSILNSPIYTASRMLNLLGLVKEQTKDLHSITKCRNGLIDLLLSSQNVFDFLDKIKTDSFLNNLYENITKDIEINLDILRKLEPTVSLKNNKIFIHEIKSPHKFELAEHILKAHIRHLKYNETFVIYSSENNHASLRIYTSNDKIDCEYIIKQFLGGGHKNRAGVTDMPLTSMNINMIIETIIEWLKDMVLTDE